MGSARRAPVARRHARVEPVPVGGIHRRARFPRAARPEPRLGLPRDERLALRAILCVCRGDSTPTRAPAEPNKAESPAGSQPRIRRRASTGPAWRAPWRSSRSCSAWPPASATPAPGAGPSSAPRARSSRPRGRPGVYSPGSLLIAYYLFGFGLLLMHYLQDSWLFLRRGSLDPKIRDVMVGAVAIGGVAGKAGR